MREEPKKETLSEVRMDDVTTELEKRLALWEKIEGVEQEIEELYELIIVLQSAS